MIKEANAFNFKKLVGDSDIIYFYGQTCGPCKMIKPHLQELAEEGKKIIAVDTGMYDDIRADYHVMSNPTLVYLKDGNEVKRTIGYMPTEAIKEILESL